MAPLPVLLVAGFLGAGKTTLINRLLRATGAHQIGVLVNDFGALAIDADLIDGADDGVIALSNGCACCMIGDDFHRALGQMLDRRPRFRHLIIEASGVAAPRVLAQTILAEPDLSLGAIVGIADCINFPVQIDDPAHAPILIDQLRAADPIIISKSLRIDAWQLAAMRQRLAQLVPSAKLLTDTDKDMIETIAGLLRLSDRQPILAAPAMPLSHRDHFIAWSAETAHCLHRDRLLALLQAPPCGTVRLKGWARLADGTGVEFHRAGQDYRLSECAALPGSRQDGAALVCIGTAGRFTAAAMPPIWQDLLAVEESFND